MKTGENPVSAATPRGALPAAGVRAWPRLLEADNLLNEPESSKKAGPLRSLRGQRGTVRPGQLNDLARALPSPFSMRPPPDIRGGESPESGSREESEKEGTNRGLAGCHRH